MLHHAHDHNQVDNQHQDHRNHRGLKECIRIPDRVIRWQTVTVVIHRHNNIFKHRIAEYISDNRSQQCYNNRHEQIVLHQLSFRVTGRAQCSDRGGLFCNRIADRHGKDKCDDCHKDIQQHTAHGFVRSHIIGCKIDRRISVFRCVIFELIVRNNHLCEQCTHKIIRACFFPGLIRRLRFIFPCISIVNTLVQPVETVLCHHCHIKFQCIKHQIGGLFV